MRTSVFLRIAAAIACIAWSLPSEAQLRLQLSPVEQVKASWYGPGFFGHKTRCGQTYTKRSIGIAVPAELLGSVYRCGQVIHIYYSGRVYNVPVIDTGSFGWKYRRGIDLSFGLAGKLGVRKQGVVDVGLDVVVRPEIQRRPRIQSIVATLFPDHAQADMTYVRPR